jgi:hypothetical protein
MNTTAVFVSAIKWREKMYHIRYEKMGGEWFYMIYKRGFLAYHFFERWNAPETAIQRLEELME